MYLPPFEEFLEFELNQSYDTVSKLIAIHCNTYDLSTPESVKLFTAQILGAARGITIEQLSRYHAWISQYISQDQH